MHLAKSLMLLAAVTSGVAARPAGHERRQAYSAPSPTSSALPSSSSSGSAGGWTATPPGGQFSEEGFGKSTASSGSDITYQGNTGDPWGSNIIEVSSESASLYKNVAQFTGQNTEPWTIVFWNKYGSDGQMNGWFGPPALDLNLGPGDVKYVAFQDDSQGGWSAAPGDTVPTGPNGGFSATWGEFDFSSSGNTGWSGFDVSAIVPQNAGLPVQGMQICQATGGDVCSSITSDAASVDNAYTTAETDIGGVGGNISGGPVRLAVVIDYSG